MPVNHCLSCGFCCTHYRVSFHWSESDQGLGGRVPFELTEPVCGTMKACMKGTLNKPVRCVALVGDPGKSVGCAIHERRPSVCRLYGPHLNEERDAWEAHPEELKRCNTIRLLHGLPPLDHVALDPAKEA